MREGGTTYGSAEDPSRRKASFRKRFRRYRRSLDDSDYRELSRAIIDRTAALDELQTASTVHVYWPLTKQREVDTRPLVSTLESDDKRIVLPVVERFESGSPPDMIHVRYHGADALRTNRWGISEPARGERIDVRDLDAVIVPALGAGRNGHRIGHGRGYYDHFLAGIDVPKICLVYHSCLVDAVPYESHDIPVDIIITEKETLKLRDM
ncbi:MAG: 5-formyltetrahydrofolate cyclo-ligase [Rhodothermales bacterium]